jgi:hypothetical protein
VIEATTVSGIDTAEATSNARSWDVSLRPFGSPERG